MDISVKVSTPTIDRLAKQLSPAGRRVLSEAAVKGLFVHIREWLRRYASTHHASAGRLNATPTRILEQAASTMKWRADENGGAVSVAAPGIRRALRSTTIRPTAGKEFLTIPMVAFAYGRRVYEVRRDGHELFRPRGRDYLAEKVDGKLQVVYLLRREVPQRQDRTILPPDDDMNQAATDGVNMLLRRLAK